MTTNCVSTVSGCACTCACAGVLLCVAFCRFRFCVVLAKTCAREQPSADASHVLRPTAVLVLHVKGERASERVAAAGGGSTDACDTFSLFTVADWPRLRRKFASNATCQRDRRIQVFHEMMRRLACARTHKRNVTRSAVLARRQVQQAPQRHQETLWHSHDAKANFALLSNASCWLSCAASIETTICVYLSIVA